MPYIREDRREYLEESIDKLANDLFLLSTGEYNYTITQLLMRGRDLTKHPSYDKLNEAIGILEAVKLELYRRVAGPYEDRKMEVNGDVY